MEQNEERFSERFHWDESGEQLTVHMRQIDVSCDEILSELIDTLVILVERVNTKIVHFDLTGQSALPSAVLSQMLRLRHQFDEIQISNASDCIKEQLQRTKLDTFIRVLT
jgi:hypothetical protein